VYGQGHHPQQETVRHSPFLCPDQRHAISPGRSAGAREPQDSQNDIGHRYRDGKEAQPTAKRRGPDHHRQHEKDNAEEHDDYTRAAEDWSLTEAGRKEEGSDESRYRIPDHEPADDTGQKRLSRMIFAGSAYRLWAQA
jgi:hypothetical protein